MGAPMAPRSSAGIDGVNVVVSAPRDGVVLLHLRADEIAAARAAALEVHRPLAVQGPATATTTAAPMEVTSAPASESGFLDGIVGAVLGFLFG
jgi:hypothetical protein